MRLSLGASRARLVRQLLTESLLLAGIGGTLGLLLATVGARVLVSMMSGEQIAMRLGPDGASQSSVATMILREILILVSVGSVAGTVAALVLARFVESLMFGLKPHDPMTVVASIAMLLLVGVIAGYLPARRAARIDPLVALRTE